MFETFHVGYKDSFTRKILAQDVEAFARLSGDYNKLHMDEEYAHRTQFEQRVVHGFLHASLLSTLIGERIPGPGALYVGQTINFTAPVFIGDELTVSGEVIALDVKKRTLEIQTVINKGNDEKVLDGVARVRVLEQAAAPRKPKIEQQVVGSSLLSGKTALVTGGSRGIGAEIVSTLATNGAHVFLGYNKSRKAATELERNLVADGHSAKALKLDVCCQEDISQVRDIINETGTLNILINNASPRVKANSFENWSLQDMEFQYKQIVGGTFSMIQAMLPLLLKDKGKVVNVVSTAALGRTAHGWLPYVSAKSALLGLSRNLALELGPKGINVNMVSPSMVDTDLVSDVPQRFKDMAIMSTPLRRMGCVEDVAQAVLFLSSPMSDFISGENIIISGGSHME